MIEQSVLQQINKVLSLQARYANSPQEPISLKEHLLDIIAACETLMPSSEA